jgi:hypothetical protein
MDGDNAAVVRQMFVSCLERGVWERMERSFEANAEHFAPEEGSVTRPTEYRLEWTELHKTFCSEFTQLIESFLDGRAFEDVAALVRQLYLEADPNAVAFMSILRTTLDFETWVSLSLDPEKRRYVRGVVASYEAQFLRAGDGSRGSK